jgi:two-component system nitrate/nitrite sensor histidine kinase NarX
VRQVARADASAVRWSDEANRKYLLLASDCLPQAVIDEELCIPTGDCLCGQPQGGAMTRVIPILPDGPASLLGTAHAKASRPSSACPSGCTSAWWASSTCSTANPGPVRRRPCLAGDHRQPPGGCHRGPACAALQRETAVAEERSFIARELHDSIAQSLAFLKIQLGLLRNDIKSTDAARIDRTLGELDAGVHESLGDVRELLVHFRTRTNREDIAPA